MFDMVIRDGRFTTPAGIVEGWLGVTRGLIAAIGSGPPPLARQALDAAGALVLPGGIDPHVHFRDPGQTYKEDFATGSAAASGGGVTTVFDMPTTVPPVMSPDVFEAKRAIAEAKSYVDFGLIAGADADNLDQLASLTRCGAVAFKVFTFDRGAARPRGVTDDTILRRTFEAIRDAGRLACVHAQDGALLQHFAERIRVAGRRDPHAYLESRPAACEVEAVERVILLAGEIDVHLHLVQLSAAESADLVAAAKARRQAVTAETGPQQLLLHDRYYEALGPRLKMSPPIRTAADAARLWAGVLDGTIDMLATDHAPHTPEEKLKDDMFDAAPGFVGVETALPLMLTQVHAGRLTLAHLNRLRAEMPARVFGLYPRKGAILVGADADLVVVDPDHEWTIRAEQLHSRSRVTPFDGWPVKGAVRATLVRGHIVYQQPGSRGEVTSPLPPLYGPPIGRMVRPLEV